MSDRGGEVEWVETTEEEVVIEECVPAVHHSTTEISIIEAEEVPVQTLAENGETTEAEDEFYCEECVRLFQDQSDPATITGPSFVLDYPTSMDVPQRALLTLPYGLMIGRSSLPTAGVGVMNHGQAVSPGMHFGPYEGEMTTREDAMASDYAWEMNRGEQEYEYIDAARESHSNWMRYINSARNKDETNLLAVQYKGNILYHCCRTINPGDELMVWPSDRFLAHFSEAWAQTWLLKLNSAETNMASEVFLCPHCQLTFTTEAFLQRHMEYFHLQPAGGCTETPAPEESLPPDTDPVPPVASKTCEDCGKIFKQTPHLRRHRLCVHSNKRPYCCAQCKRTFSQASGFLRHQLVHRKKAPLNGEKEGVEEEEGAPPSETPDPAAGGEAEEMEASEDQQEVEREEEADESSQPNCSDCGKKFSSVASLKKHKTTVHEKLRPYVCNVCQKSFNQFHDLNRHLLLHGKQNKRKGKEAADDDAMPFGCAKCSLTFSSVDSLERHIDEQHSLETEESPDQSKDADFVPPPSVAQTAVRCPSQRPQRLGARSRISAITKLIAPKRRGSGDGNASPKSKTKKEEGEPDVGAAGFKKFKWFSCNRCKRTYSDADDLKAHKCALKQLKCGQCGAAFHKSGFLRRHEQKAHADHKSYACQHCDKAFSAPSKLRQHQKTNNCAKYHCTSELFPCSFCQFSFTMKSYLLKHVKRHHPAEFLSQSDGLVDNEEADEDQEEALEKKSYTCPHCAKRFANTRALKCHACFQQVKILYLCTDCGKGFSNHYGLKQHQRIHTGEKPYSCPHCHKSFSYTGQLNVHLRTHTGEKPYLCTHCGESFRQSGDLKRHERKHTGVRPYTCAECHKSFSRPQSLKVHQMLHRGEKMFKCTQCGKSFSRNYHLRRHHQKMHL